ncbi:MAG: NADH-quinone oxidoreductase subunit H [Candidatus Gastranaerophilales bacterium]|nr:NADH-quinone oxidoreductase subunit H [Candidatus Gastranaerophilales bacterium]
MVMKEIAERYCVRNFSDKQLPDEVIKEILEAGRLSPSWMNTQSWHFIVVKNDRNKALLSQLSHGQPHVEKAQAVILCCGDKDTWEEELYRGVVSSKKGITPERVEMLLKNPAYNPKLQGEQMVLCRCLEQVTYAIAYMTIAAHACGVGACIIGAMGNELTKSVPEVYELAKKTFNVPDNLTILAMLALGYPAESAEKPEKKRKPFNEVVSWESYGRTL